MAQLLWTNNAHQQLDSIRTYIESNNSYFAERYINRMLRRIELLKSFPESGELQPQYRGSNVRQVVFGNYRIIFQSTTTVVRILAIQHAAISGDPELF